MKVRNVITPVNYMSAFDLMFPLKKKHVYSMTNLYQIPNICFLLVTKEND